MKKDKQDFVVKIDGVGLYARSFAAMSKADAVKRMETDGISNDADWAGKAYDKLVDEVKKKDEQQEPQPEVKAKGKQSEPAKTFLVQKEEPPKK